MEMYRGLTTKKGNNCEFNEIWVEGDLIHSEGKVYIHPVSDRVCVKGELGSIIVMHEVQPDTVEKITGGEAVRWNVHDNEYLEMTWSLEDTIKNLKIIKEAIKVKIQNTNLDGKAEQDVKELEFDFGRAVKSLEKQIPYKPKECEDKYYSCKCGNILLHKWDEYPIKLTQKSQGLPYCLNCGQKIDWVTEL